MATKTNGFLGEASKKKKSNCCSFNEAEMPSPRLDCSCNDRHQTNSEISHPLSVCLSHDSFSENAESEETFRDSNTSNCIEEGVKTELFQTSANRIASLKTPVLSDQLEKRKGSECLGDNIALVSSSDHSKTRTSYHTGNMGKENIPYTSASVDNFSETEKEIVCCSNKSDLSEISSFRDSFAGAISTKGERSESSEEQVQSSFATGDALQIGSQTGEEHNSAESLHTETGINEKEQTADVASMNSVKKVNVDETTIGSLPSVCTDGSDNIEYDVKVCDICGDIGREELLAVCSKCNDGAEHIYCMRVKMDSVPKGNWMCEECIFSEEMEKQKQGTEDQRNEIFRKLNALEAETKLPEVEGSKTYENGSTHFSPKRPASLQAVRKAPFETALKPYGTLSSRSKISGGHSSGTTPKTLHVPTETSSKSPKLSSQSYLLKGSLFKSKSFSTMRAKSDAQLLKEHSGSMKGLGKETTANTRKERLFSKSRSMKMARSYSLNNIDACCDFSHGEGFNRSMNAKWQYSKKTTKKWRLAGSDSLASRADRKIASTSKSSLQHSSSQSCHDVVAAKGNEVLDNSLKVSGHSAQGGSANKEKKKVINVKRKHAEDVLPATSTNHSRVNVLPGQQPCVRDLSKFGSSVHTRSWTSAVPQLDYIWNGNFEIQSTEGLHYFFGGMQAHLSSYASNRVVEVVHKLPQNLLLEEVPRLSLWPTQFIECHAAEDNIALYFFAENLNSYERSYGNLLDRMIKNDFSLKGKFDGVDLLLFPSNLLPEQSRRWNNLLFLWGVLKGKRVHCSGQVPTMSTTYENLEPAAGSTEISASLSSHNAKQSTLLDQQEVKWDGFCETKAPSWEQNPPELPTSCSQEIGTVNDQTKNELFARANSPKRKERESKGRPEIDLNYCIQESKVDIADQMEVDERNNFKRLKTSFSGMDVNNNGSITDTNHRENGPDSNVSSLPLKLGVESSTYPDQGNIPPFIMLMGSKVLPGKNLVRETSGDTNPSLALSLALPNPETSSWVYKVGSKGGAVHTTLSLFGASLDS